MRSQRQASQMSSSHSNFQRVKSEKAKERKEMSREEMKKKERESLWDSSPHAVVPEYSSERDPHCPRAVVREYNKTKKLNALERSKKGQGASDWIENTIKKKFEDIPVREAPTLREKATTLAAVEDESVPEVEILQTIIIRENLLKELEGLLKFQTDIDGVLSEAVEIVKAIRCQSLDIVEAIFAWKKQQKSPMRQFYYQGKNYLLKMMEDMSFLDQYDELGEYFGFYFSGNPLLYSGVPENEMSSLLNTSTDNQPLHNPSSVDSNANLIDGISESRIRAAENIVFKEQAAVAETDGREGASIRGQPSQLAIGEGNMYDSVVGDAFAVTAPVSSEGRTQSGHYEEFGAHQLSSSASIASRMDHQKPPKEKKGTKRNRAMSTKSQKKNRIKQLRSEVEELQAMNCHVKDQVASLVEEHRALAAQHSRLDRRREEAISLENAALAKRLAVEMSVLESELEHRSSEVKSHQRQSYFLQQEVARRKGLVKTLLSELSDLERKSTARKRLLAIQKKEGIFSALLQVDSVMEETKKPAKAKRSVEGQEEKQKTEEDGSLKRHEDVEHTSGEEKQEDFAEDDNGDNDSHDDDSKSGFAHQSVFSAMELDAKSSISADCSLILEDETNADQNSATDTDTQAKKWCPPPEDLLPVLPVPHADRIVDDVNALASRISSNALASSLEMMWFVMGAAEEVRPLKIASQKYVASTLNKASTNLACCRVTSESTVLECLLEGFQRATFIQLKRNVYRARQSLASTVVEKVSATGLCIAANIIHNEAKAKEDRLKQRIRVFSNELADITVKNVFDTVLTAITVKAELERIDAQRVEEEKRRRIMDEVASVCDEFTFGGIGAALYTVENKVMRYKRAMDSERKTADPNSVGVVVHPAGGGFALAKMIKERKGMMQLEMYDLDSKTGVKHTFPSSASRGDVSIDDLIHEALENTGENYGLLMYGKEIGVVHETEVEYEDWVFDAKLIQDVDQIKLVALCTISGLEKSVTFVLSKDQEQDLENTRNKSNFMKYILTKHLQS